MTKSCFLRNKVIFQHKEIVNIFHLINTRKGEKAKNHFNKCRKSIYCTRYSFMLNCCFRNQNWKRTSLTYLKRYLPKTPQTP